MTPVRCIAPAGEQGDCWRACIASILNLPAAEVPNFAHLADDSWCRMYELGRAWLKTRDLGIFRTYYSAGWALDEVLETLSAPNIDVPIILAGQSGRDPREAHAVVVMNGEVVHDPSGAGVAGPYPCNCGAAECDSKGWWWLDVVAFTASSRLLP